MVASCLVWRLLLLGSRCCRLLFFPSLSSSPPSSSIFIRLGTVAVIIPTYTTHLDTQIKYIYIHPGSSWFILGRCGGGYFGFSVRLWAERVEICLCINQSDFKMSQQFFKRPTKATFSRTCVHGSASATSVSIPDDTSSGPRLTLTWALQLNPVAAVTEPAEDGRLFKIL